MSEVKAPERLWADWDYDANDGVCGVHTKKKYASGYEPDAPPIEYVRADLLATAIRQARNDALREAAAIASDNIAIWSDQEETPDPLSEYIEYLILSFIDRDTNQ